MDLQMEMATMDQEMAHIMVHRTKEMEMVKEMGIRMKAMIMELIMETSILEITMVLTMVTKTRIRMDQDQETATVMLDRTMEIQMAMETKMVIRMESIMETTITAK